MKTNKVRVIKDMPKNRLGICGLKVDDVLKRVGNNPEFGKEGTRCYYSEEFIDANPDFFTPIYGPESFLDRLFEIMFGDRVSEPKMKYSEEDLIDAVKYMKERDDTARGVLYK